MPRGVYKRSKKVKAKAVKPVQVKRRIYATGNRIAPAIHHDPVNHPAHYTRHPSGVECIDVTEHFNFNRGNAIKYIWRADEKGSRLENLRKAAWYLNREIERLEKEAVK